MPIVRVELLPGRTEDQKVEYAFGITRLTTEILKCEPEAVQVIFSEIKPQDWAHAGRLYAPPSEPRGKDGIYDAPLEGARDDK